MIRGLIAEVRSLAILCVMRSRYILLLTFILGSVQYASAELFSGRVYTDPRKIYVNQPFDIFLELEVTQGQDIDNIRIQGFPNNPEYITLGTLEQERVRRSRRRQNGNTADILIFKAKARCHKRISQLFKPVLSCDLVERRSRGFFSFSSSNGRRIQLTPFNLTVRDLPSKGRPKSFSGAVGKFKLNGVLSKSDVRPGDIITLKLELTGKGWLNNAPAPAPAKSELFKSYPPKEILRQDNLIKTEQIFIPNSTNALAITPARFTYFNPETERYEVCASPSFRLNYISAETTIQTNEINVISSGSAKASTETGSVSINVREVNNAFHKILPVASACLTLLAASFIFLIVIKINKWAAAATALLTMALGGFLTIKSIRYKPAQEIELKTDTSVYLTPSANSPLIMKLRPSTKVIPLESTERWTRIEAEKQRGWVENRVLVR